MLNASRIKGSHPGAYIADKIKEILESWFIYSDQVHVIVRNNGSNMVRGMKDTVLHTHCNLCTMVCCLKEP